MPGLITAIETECSVDAIEPDAVVTDNASELDAAVILGTTPTRISDLYEADVVKALNDKSQLHTVLGILDKQTQLSFFRLVQKNDKLKPTTEQEAFGSLKEGVVLDRAHEGDKTQFNKAVFGSIFYLVDDGAELHVVVSKAQMQSMDDPDINAVCSQVAVDYLAIKSMRYRGKPCFSKQSVHDRLWKKLKRAGHTF